MLWFSRYVGVLSRASFLGRCIDEGSDSLDLLCQCAGTISNLAEDARNQVRKVYKHPQVLNLDFRQILCNSRLDAKLAPSSGGRCL